MENRQTPVTLQALGTTNVAAAVVTFDGIEGEGDSKRNNGEKRQPHVGMDLALGRAFINLGEKLVKRGIDALPEVPEAVDTRNDLVFLDGVPYLRGDFHDLLEAVPAGTYLS